MEKPIIEDREQAIREGKDGANQYQHQMIKIKDREQAIWEGKDGANQYLHQFEMEKF